VVCDGAEASGGEALRRGSGLGAAARRGGRRSGAGEARERDHFSHDGLEPSSFRPNPCFLTVYLT
jgi:hypothetical protein